MCIYALIRVGCFPATASALNNVSAKSSEDKAMSKAASHLESVGAKRSQSSSTRKLIQAAALAAMLVPLGSVAVETATISCVSTGNFGSGCGGGSYSGGIGLQSNVWKFFTDSSFAPSSLLYSFEIGATPLTSYSLRVEDFVTNQASLVSSGALVLFPTATCLSTRSPGSCGLFDVSGGSSATSATAYDITIKWFVNSDPLSQPPNDGFNTILQAKDATFPVFGNSLALIQYDPAPTPTDPALGGRADGFSRFGAFRTAPVPVPEPGSLLLIGMGVAGILTRSRLRKRDS